MKIVNIKCPLLGCENPIIETYGGLTMATRLDQHLMKDHSMEDILDYARRQIMKYNKTRMEDVFK